MRHPWQTNKLCFESLDESLKDIMDTNDVPCEKLFGGKIVVFGGELQQMLRIFWTIAKF